MKSEDKKRQNWTLVIMPSFIFFITARLPAVDFRDKCDKLFSIISLTTTKSTFKL